MSDKPKPTYKCTKCGKTTHNISDFAMLRIPGVFICLDCFNALYNAKHSDIEVKHE